MIRIRVRRDTISDETHEGLLSRIERVCEAFRNRGDRIIAIVPSPMPMRETSWVATIFSEHFAEDK
jgi:hypothetical protein